MAKGGPGNKNQMTMVHCPKAGGPVWANSTNGFGTRCTKCGQEGHSAAQAK